MKKSTILIVASSVAAAAAVGLMAQVRVASASTAPVKPSASAVVRDEPVLAPAPISRRQRMARIVAEQAAITAEASARSALAYRATERDGAAR